LARSLTAFQVAADPLSSAAIERVGNEERRSA
jgi:hypothetical protein